MRCISLRSAEVSWGRTSAMDISPLRGCFYERLVHRYMPKAPEKITEEDDDLGVDAVWEHEILARIQAVDDGTARGVPYEEMMSAADRLAQ